ncbi:60S acidic ribosomal protein P2-4 [Hibiscus syriacus]|uniref:60S acidic ribosomal protein P2-4 n=1 Tax=Hibiscus syriacus TaxID=106335 RepID=A0A6A2XCL3_HIBSY|nr:60S acidic ribosomal protein P2-4 [Hibiscus syriacus]
MKLGLTFKEHYEIDGSKEVEPKQNYFSRNFHYVFDELSPLTDNEIVDPVIQDSEKVDFQIGTTAIIENHLNESKCGNLQIEFNFQITEYLTLKSLRLTPKAWFLVIVVTRSTSRRAEAKSRYTFIYRWQRSFKDVFLGGDVAVEYAMREFAKQEVQSGELAIIFEEAVAPHECLAQSKVYFFPKGAATCVGFHVCVESGGEILLLHCSTVIWLTEFRVQGADAKIIVYLREIDGDAKTKRKDKVAIFGGGYIGLELGATMNINNFGVNMMFPEPWCMHQFFILDTSTFYENYYPNKGIKGIEETVAIGFIVKSKRVVKEAELQDGRVLKLTMSLLVGCFEHMRLQWIEISTWMPMDDFRRTNPSKNLEDKVLFRGDDIVMNKRFKESKQVSNYNYYRCPREHMLRRCQGRWMNSFIMHLVV